MKKKIWCVFSIDNEYNQPSNNLVAWWGIKPSFKTLAKALGLMVDLREGNKYVGQILNGKTCRIGQADYRLETKEEEEE